MAFRVMISESIRALLSWIIAVLVIIPALIIYVADRLTLRFLRHRDRRG